MENAAKALTMAGSILIGLMILSMLVYMFTHLGEAASEQDKLKEIEQITEFNLQYETYDRKDVYGAELLSLINKIADYNERESETKGYLPMNMTVKFVVYNDYWQTTTIKDVNVLKDKVVKAEKDQEEAEKLAKQEHKINNYIPFSEFKRKLFKCTGVEYDEKNGRIIKMHFEEVDTAALSN